MPDTRPILKCSYKGCPCIGRFGDTGRCPMHSDPTLYPPPRIPTLAESWTDLDTGGR